MMFPFVVRLLLPMMHGGLNLLRVRLILMGEAYMNDTVAGILVLVTIRPVNVPSFLTRVVVVDGLKYVTL